MSKITRDKTVKAPGAAAKPAAAKKAVKAATKSATAKVDGNAISEGDKAPAFTLPRDGGGEVSLASFKGRKLVLFFYPRADTPGCTLEAVAFTRLKPDFDACDTEVMGVSADPLKAQDKFRDKHSLATPLLSDETQTMLKAYGAWGEKSMYGKIFEGVLRTTVLIDATGRIAAIWRNVKVDGHADAVLEAARKL